MNMRIFIIALFSIMLAACNHQHNTADEHEGHNHEGHNHEGHNHEGHNHEAEATHSHAHEDEDEDEAMPEHEEPKFQYTAYSKDFELFAEADPFITGQTANVLAHFSSLPDFTALLSGSIKLVLTVNGRETVQILDKPSRKGIYSFDIQPETSGTGVIIFEITTENGSFEVIVPQVNVFSNHQQAHEAAEEQEVQKTNTTVFTKEQSWKIDFSTALPAIGPFGEVIKATALVQASQGSEMVVPARTSGIVHISANQLIEGREVTSSQALCSIKAGNMVDNNMAVRFSEAENNFEKARADYERAKELAKDKIVSEKDLIAAKNQFENSKAVYENLKRNFNASGQSVVSPMTGFIKQVFIKNGAYVEAGQALFTVSQNRLLTLTADLPMKYASVLGTIQSANIRIPNDERVYTFEELNGKVLAYGKSAGAASHLIPISLQIINKGGFIPGSFVEVYLKTLTNTNALTVPVSALIEEQGSFFVWVQITPELFEKREVLTGKTDGLKLEIVKGLDPDERIVSLGAMMIKLAQATGTLDAHSGHVH